MKKVKVGITTKEKMKFVSKEFFKDYTESGGYDVFSFIDSKKNSVNFHGENKVTRAFLKKGEYYTIIYTKIKIENNRFRGFRPLSIQVTK